ncbi:hypothetical protein BU25DRAFT_265741 [Macroventuria anomochaeta]|uniref:Uncharacterized protein n=1 Tax=Macroventuria anomochaeta TaxID=301207 RepID=A0ACB6S762_9PLEO|nr:uncharacterized protein BU25DRAFT_265741 [Macroventuria anomochaeta]KAF2630110.1 hypothetical protein BU25DRAFT_265741 [Macroventuria anomochaeta]
METFNPKNGQIYTETTLSSVRSMVPMWKRHIRGRMLNPQAYRNTEKGSSTLRDMAMRSCCWNIHLFVPEALEDPGWHYAGMIYHHLKATDTLTFEAWTLLQQAYPNQPELNHHFRVGKLDSITSWPSIVNSLSSINSVLTQFCAYGLELNLSQLLSLTEIPTLAALIHAHPAQRNFNPLRGSGVRDWCRAVREKKAFQKLKLLYMSSIPQDGPLNSAVLENLSSFPSLALVGIERRSPFDPSTTYGQWERPGSTQEDKLSKTMCGLQYSIAEKTKRLYRYAQKVSLPETEAENTVSLALTCYADGSAHHVGDISWFIRKQVLPELHSKRPQDTQALQDGSERGTKKRKIRQGKQQDVGSLLGTFG